MSDWIVWGGGWCPVPEGTEVCVKYQDGEVENISRPENLVWIKTDEAEDIVAYKILGEQTIAVPQIHTPAEGFLRRAAKHMEDRAATYDKPDGERSMAQTTSIFNLYHGTDMTEAQGWHFMQILKDVRLFTRKEFHNDSAEDAIAYAALKAEAHQRKEAGK